VIKPGGRFTISDIVSDQVVPQYLIHDSAKWGDCLSGALTVADYLGGLVEAGFVGVHQLTFIPWRVIDGIHFLSLTLTGYKTAPVQRPEALRYATLRGPFKQVLDEHGRAFTRGVPQAIDETTASSLRTTLFESYFLFSEEPLSLVPPDPRLTGIVPEPAPCVWKGHFALLTGPFQEACDDDHHVYRRGVPLEICSKTLAVLNTPAYRPHFAIINRAGQTVSGTAVSCDPNGACC
jgi:hypothetical protein